MSGTIEKYGRIWQANADPLRIEIECIRMGYGHKHTHYEAMRKLIWPRLDSHRWHTLCLKEITKNKVTVLMGPKSTGKTHEMAWYGLCKYFVSPDDTIVLVSSTDIRGLKLRVWGEITMLWSEAVDRFPWLPGHHLDSKIAITTDQLDDGDFEQRTVRDMRKGIIGIPCIVGNKWVGISKYCFAAGTLVDTCDGKRPIETVRKGDKVWCAGGLGTVENTASRISSRLCRIHFSDGTKIDCTPDHRFLTKSGWQNAIDILPHTELLSIHEAMQSVWGRTSQAPKAILLSELSPGKLEKIMLGMRHKFCSVRTEGKFLQPVVLRKKSLEESGLRSTRSESGHSCQGKTHFCKHHGQCQRTTQTQQTRQENRLAVTQHEEVKETTCLERLRCRSQSNPIGACHPGPFSGSTMELSGGNWEVVQTSSHSAVLDRLCLSETATCCRDRWQLSPQLKAGYPRFPKGLVFEGKRVERVEVLIRRRDAGYHESEGGYRVYNLQVDLHPSYSVNGLAVHNCGIKQKHVLLLADELALMGPSFLGSFSNLDANPDFQAVCAFNPVDPLDQGGKAAEPADGWNTHMAPEKTTTWDTLFMGGRCINLVGTDTPNNDPPKTDTPRYSYLLNQRQIDATAKAFGQESIEFYSQCLGVMKVSLLSHRVLNRDLCEKGNAFKEAVWVGSLRVNIGALDASYGGDRCVFTWIEFGEAVGGAKVIQCHPPENVPVVPTPGEDPEYCIARWVKNRCEELNIPPENFFHDSTGRGSLGTALARVWSAQCTPVEFGGKPTSRPVPETYQFDPRTGERIMKTWADHAEKFVTELWFAVRYCVEAGQLRGLKDEVLYEFACRIWRRTKNDKIEVEPKSGTPERPGMKQRLGFSPDLADSLAIAVEGARRKGFVIAKLENEEAQVDHWEWILEMSRKRRELERKSELVEV